MSARKKIKSDRICATCRGDKILLQKKNFSQKFSSTHEAICRSDVSARRVAGTSRPTCTHGVICRRSRRVAATCRLVCSTASDRGQNRYSDFVALETLLRFENCSSSHCLLSSWRRFHVFESSYPSFHRTVFFVIFMSSCRRLFLSSTALHT